MTATDELRRLLDERGVKWMPVAWNPKRETFYHAANGVGFCADEYTDGVKIYTDATITPAQAIAATLGPCNDSCNCTNGERTDLAAENAMLREQMERLVTLLRNDCDIDASWDGLRKFWSIGLTEEGCLMRDRACKAEAENAKLFALLKHESEQTEKLREFAEKITDSQIPGMHPTYEEAIAEYAANLRLADDGKEQ